jgi:hypothetical protein
MCNRKGTFNFRMYDAVNLFGRDNHLLFKLVEYIITNPQMSKGLAEELSQNNFSQQFKMHDVIF